MDHAPAKPPPAGARHQAAPPRKTPRAGQSARAAAPRAVPAGLRLTHPQRVIDPSSGITKLDLALYYAAAARLMLPHLRARPVALLRAPEGLGGELFFQKHGGQLRIPGLQRLDPALDPGHEPLLEVSTAPALLGAVQMNVIEFHTWNATTKAIDRPDRMTFDLDPGEGLAWPRMLEAAQLLHGLLDELKLASRLKTSGGKGLHVIVPLAPGADWAAVRGLAQAIVQHLARTRPERFVARSGPAHRVGRIFVDYLRNGRGATTVAAWSARARPGLGVSVPVAWDELDALTSGAHWTLRTVDERLARPDPWRAGRAAPVRRPALRAAMQALETAAPPAPAAPRST